MSLLPISAIIDSSIARKSDFSPIEWNTLRDTPYLVGFAVLLAGLNGPATIAELIALCRGAIENQLTDGSPISRITAVDEMDAAQASVKQSFRATQGTPSVDTVRRRALEQTRSSMAILARKASNYEADAYRRMLYRTAEKIADTAREKGFNRFGGTQVIER